MGDRRGAFAGQPSDGNAPAEVQAVGAVHACQGSVSRTVSIDGRDVTLNVCRLSEAERQRLAATIAWLALEEAAAGLGAWRAFAADVVGMHVAFTIHPRDLESADPVWWGRAVYGAATALIEVNGLEPELRHSLLLLDRSLRGVASAAPLS